MIVSLRQLRDQAFLLVSIACALWLVARLVYIYLADPIRYPVTTFKVVANYQHVTREDIETILRQYEQEGFFSMPTRQLSAKLSRLAWVDKVHIHRIWPDTLKVSVIEKKPVAWWNDDLLTQDGQLLKRNTSGWQQDAEAQLPKLSGPKDQQADVLQMFQKLSKLLLTYGLRANALILRDNQSWELTLANGVIIRLGKRDIEYRLLRFCQAYPEVFADKIEHLSAVDLRYGHGMAAQWKETTKKAG